MIAPELFKENLEDERKLLAQCLFQISYTKRLTAEEVMALARVIQNYDTQTVADHQTRVVLLVSLLTSLEPSHYGHSQANRAVNLRENDAFTRDFEALLLAAWRNALTQNAVSLAWGIFLQRQVSLLSLSLSKVSFVNNNNKYLVVSNSSALAGPLIDLSLTTR